MGTPKIVVLEGDQTGQELLVEALRVLDPAVTKAPVDFVTYDLSLGNRRNTKNQVVYEAAKAIRESGYGLKAATVTPEAKGDVGSPNAILRREVDGTVILRTGRPLPGVPTIGGISAPIAVVRMATEDAYDAREWSEGDGDETKVFRTTHLSLKNCRAAAEFSFLLAAKMNAQVFGASKYTISPVYEALFKQALDEAAARHPEISYDPVLIDSAYALLFGRASRPLVMPALNRDGDILSDLVMALYGTIASAESLILGFDESLQPRVVIAEAPHGTAPSLQGKNVANPLAMILAGASLLNYMPGDEYARAAAAIRDACMDALADGIRTTDLQGSDGTREFTDAVIERVKRRLA
ncbi:MAG: isocitrate/isopropylmalate family dehydrogenase [Mycobacterium leprae]